MSIEIDNPIGKDAKIDAAANLVAQASLAIRCSDKDHALKSLEKAGKLLFDAMHGDDD